MSHSKELFKSLKENIMKKVKYFILFGLLIILTNSCQDFLEVNPKAIILDSQLNDPKYVDGFVNAAYAFMPQVGYNGTMNPWVTSVRSDDAYKGGGSLDDQVAWYYMEVFSLVNPNILNNNNVWDAAYRGLSRVNTAITALENLDESTFPLKTQRIAEMRFLRGWIYFKLLERFKWVPMFDETATTEEIKNIPNRPEGVQDNLDLWQKVYDDLIFAADNLPETQVDKGRVNEYAAKSYLIKTLLWMAYPQDLNNQITAIDLTKLTEALGYCNEIVNSEKYFLCSDYAENFLPQYDNTTPESIWELQFTIKDGTTNGLKNYGNVLNGPWFSPSSVCCDFHKASYNLVNAFRVDANGLPLFDTFNDAEITDKIEYFASNDWDPRLSHTVAIPGYPWKYQINPLLKYDSTGSRKPAIYGYFHSMKENAPAGCNCVTNQYLGYNSMNQREVRYDEILLYQAEILIKLSRPMDALPIINQIRERASNSTQRLKWEDGSYWLNYKCGQYLPGVNCTWDEDFAWKALVWESRLELAMEGRRFFDLVRWGEVKDVMNSFMEKEGTRYSWYRIGRFNSGRDEYLPIPQIQIDRAKGVYVQNPGY